MLGIMSSDMQRFRVHFLTNSSSACLGRDVAADTEQFFYRAVSLLPIHSKSQKTSLGFFFHFPLHSKLSYGESGFPE